MNSRTSSAQPHPFAAGSVRSSHAPPSLRSAVAAWGGDTDTDLDPHSDAPLDPSQALRRAVRAICSDGHYLIEQVHKAEDTAQTPAILRGVFVIDPATRRPQLKRASALPLLALHPEHAGSLTALQENADPGRQFVCWVSVEGYRLPRQVHTCAIVDAVDGATVWEGPVHAPKSAASKRDTASRTSRSPALASDRLPSRGPSASVRQPSADDERFAAPLPSSLDTTLHSPPALPPRPPQGASELSYMTSPDAARPRRVGPTTPLTRRDFSPEVNGHIDPAVAVSSGLLDLASRKARGESAGRQSLSSQPLSNAEQQQNQRATSAVGQTPQDKGLMRAYHPDRVSVSPSNVVSPPAALFPLGSPDATIGRDAPISAATVNDMGGATKLDELLQVAAVCSQATAKIMSAVDDAHGRLDKLYDITVPLTAGPPAERQAKDVALKMDELSSRLALMEEYVRAIELRQADVLSKASAAATAALVTQATQVDITPEPVPAPQPPSVTQATQTEPEAPTVPQPPRPISAPMGGSVGISRDASTVFDSASVAEPSVLDAPPAAAPAQAPREAPAAVEKPQAPASMKAVHEASALAVLSTTVVSGPSNEAKAPCPFEVDVAQELAMMLVEAGTAPGEPTAPSSEPQASQAAAVQQALTSVLLEAQAEAPPRDMVPTIPPAVSLISAPMAPTAPVHQLAAPAEETLASQILGHVTSTVPSDRGVSAVRSETAVAPMQGQAAEPQAEPEVVPQPYERPAQPPALPLPPYGQTLRYEAPGTPTEQP